MSGILTLQKLVKMDKLIHDAMTSVRDSQLVETYKLLVTMEREMRELTEMVMKKKGRGRT